MMAESKPQSNNLFDAAKTATDALEKLTPEDRALAIEMIARKLNVESVGAGTPSGPASKQPASRSNLKEDSTPREFMAAKRPSSDQDKVTCLAYYLHKFRNQLEFKPKELADINIEAGQRKLSNVSQSVGNASRPGLLVSASGGNWQISPLGENYVEALPDMEAARAVLAGHKSGRAKSRRKKAAKRTSKKAKSTSK